METHEDSWRLVTAINIVLPARRFAPRWASSSQSLTFPASQSTQELAPSPEYVPRAHWAQLFDLIPSA